MDKGGTFFENYFAGKRSFCRLCQKPDEASSGIRTNRLFSTDDNNVKKRSDTYGKKIYNH